MLCIVYGRKLWVSKVINKNAIHYTPTLEIIVFGTKHLCNICYNGLNSYHD